MIIEPVNIIHDHSQQGPEHLLVPIHEVILVFHDVALPKVVELLQIFKQKSVFLIFIQCLCLLKLSDEKLKGSYIALVGPFLVLPQVGDASVFFSQAGMVQHQMADLQSIQGKIFQENPRLQYIFKFHC
jgi:hypothetical protein